jgi:hypothetical protein
VFRVNALGVTKLAELVRARYDLHATGVDGGLRERDPGCYLHCRFETEVCRVLVPTYELGPPRSWARPRDETVVYSGRLDPRLHRGLPDDGRSRLPM